MTTNNLIQMKSPLLLIATLLSLVLTLSSCGENGICVRADGNQATQVFDLADFTGIAIKGSFDVNLSQGEAQYVEVSGSQNIIDILKMDVLSDILVIDIDGCVQNEDLIINITVPELTSVEVDGSGDVKGKTAFEGTSLLVDIDGSGDVALDYTTTNQINVSISGSGNLDLAGSTSVFDCAVKGSGDVDAFEMTAKTATLTVDGSGNIKVTVTDELTATIKGSGDISYKGSPSINVEITGSGQLKDAN